MQSLKNKRTKISDADLFTGRRDFFVDVSRTGVRNNIQNNINTNTKQIYQQLEKQQQQYHNYSEEPIDLTKIQSQFNDSQIDFGENENAFKNENLLNNLNLNEHEHEHKQNTLIENHHQEKEIVMVDINDKPTASLIDQLKNPKENLVFYEKLLSECHSLLKELLKKTTTTPNESIFNESEFEKIVKYVLILSIKIIQDNFPKSNIEKNEINSIHKKSETTIFLTETTDLFLKILDFSKNQNYPFQFLINEKILNYQIEDIGTFPILSSMNENTEQESPLRCVITNEPIVPGKTCVFFLRIFYIGENDSTKQLAIKHAEYLIKYSDGPSKKDYLHFAQTFIESQRFHTKITTNINHWLHPSLMHSSSSSANDSNNTLEHYFQLFLDEQNTLKTTIVDILFFNYQLKTYFKFANVNL